MADVLVTMANIFRRAAAALVRSSQQGGGAGIVQSPTIDVEEVIDDDDEVVITSPTSFAQARRNREATITAERPPPSDDGSRLTQSSRYNLRKRPAPSDAVISADQYINLDGRRNSKKKRAVKPLVTPQAAPPKPLPKEPAFGCPVCMCSLVEATSTNCGHIFCKLCIQAALSARSKCPVCRKELSMKDTIRVYLPATELS
ncbi:hypothetical protein C5167_007158 [Papaver somniferum]|uniref:RING-type domain-containing protein n=1 Tax=Papaver somniferum TaxID=3469 RepID=A0A4Y7JIJ3_PAPSO|nr:E3 ubiquitin-protein ligase RNF4-like isoform X1 [Papaver somniferum]RZC59860.1 hypothetical protein C5167_007158 [Papaver somniferum]